MVCIFLLFLLSCPSLDHVLNYNLLLIMTICIHVCLFVSYVVHSEIVCGANNSTVIFVMVCFPYCMHKYKAHTHTHRVVASNTCSFIAFKYINICRPTQFQFSYITQRQFVWMSRQNVWSWIKISCKHISSYRMSKNCTFLVERKIEVLDSNLENFSPFINSDIFLLKIKKMSK